MKIRGRDDGGDRGAGVALPSLLPLEVKMQINPEPQRPEPPQPPGPAWQPSIGGSLCPERHYVRFEGKFCPTCGAGPVPGFVDWESRDRTARLGAQGGF